MIGKLVSIIIPVYNVEAYVEKCIESVKSQSYSQLEIILVDDGSTDESGVYCDRQAVSDSRIKVIHKKNGGLSDARNAGLDIATGEYIFFADSDDYIKSDAIGKLVEQLEQDDCDVVACGIEMVWDDETLNRPFTAETSGMWDGRQAVLEMQRNNTICSVAWNKLYRASLWKDIRFPVGKLHEDEYTTYKILYKSGRVEFIPDMLYCYYQRSTGINAGATRDDRDDHINAFYERYMFFKNAGDEEIAEWSLVKYLEYIKYIYRNTKSKERKAHLAGRYRIFYPILRSSKYIDKRKKFAIFLWNYWKY